MENNYIDLKLSKPVITALRAALPTVAERTVAALAEEVPAYARAARGSDMAASIQSAVAMALDAFLRIATEGRGVDPSIPLTPAIEASYALGRGEARAGRSIDALLTAYRVGARIAWRDLSAEMVKRRVSAASVAQFAELVFAYIDELSASSVAGHTDELATAGRVRAQYLERLGQALVQGASPDELATRAERAEWPPPATLTAVIVPSAQVRPTLQLLDHQTLTITSDVAPGTPDETAVLLVPDAHHRRSDLLAVLHRKSAVVGTSVPWTAAQVSYARALRARELVPARGDEPVDADAHLVTLVLGADPGAFGDLRTRVLAPLAGLRPATAERLAETLQSWLLHQGRREAVAADLHVHPQTVRYRMTQLRDLFGDRLDEPERVLELVVALGHPHLRPQQSPSRR